MLALFTKLMSELKKMFQMFWWTKVHFCEATGILFRSMGFKGKYPFFRFDT